MFSVLVSRLRSLRVLRVSGLVMRLRMFLLLITFLQASHSFRNRLLVSCKEDRKSVCRGGGGLAGGGRPGRAGRRGGGGGRVAWLARVGVVAVACVVTR